MVYDVIIIGAGPSGLTAAIYATRANFKTLVLAGTTWGGQLMLTSTVENFPGFPEGIQGPELMQNMRKQAERFGAEIKDVPFTSGDFTKKPFAITAGEDVYEGKSVIITTGADARWLGAKGETERIGKGVSSCATCDAFFFRGKDVVVVGGGDSAMEDAMVLAKVANSVTLVHRRDEFRASSIMQERVKADPKITIMLDSEITEITGNGKVEGVTIQHVKTKELTQKAVTGVFVAIGHIPNTKVFSGIDLDEEGYVKVAEHFHTNVEGVFVAGDVHDRSYRQAITAAGFGCAAALETQHYLERQAAESLPELV